MRIRVAILTLFLGAQAVAVEAPLVAPGDYLFIRGRVIGCELGVQMVDFAQVDERGEVVVLDDIPLSVADRPVHWISTALADSLEARTGYRPKTLEVIWVSKSDQEQIARRLMFFARTGTRQCRDILEPMNPASSGAVSGIARNTPLEAVAPGPDAPGHRMS